MLFYQIGAELNASVILNLIVIILLAERSGITLELAQLVDTTIPTNNKLSPISRQTSQHLNDPLHLQDKTRQGSALL